jgi:hypothetical protein
MKLCSSHDNLNHIGKTRGFIFLNNIQDQTSNVFPIKEVKLISIKKGVFLRRHFRFTVGKNYSRNELSDMLIVSVRKFITKLLHITRTV